MPFSSLLVAVAIGVPQLGNSIALVGSLAGSAVLFVFPALLHTLVIWEDRHQFGTVLSIIKNFVVIFLGIVGAIAGTFEAMRAILTSYEISSSSHKLDGLAVIFHNSTLSN